jgi:hypothetical protein
LESIVAKDKSLASPVGSKPTCTRLQRGGTAARQQTQLFEILRELTFETCLEVAGSSLRIGLAASAWQLQQARLLLEHFQLPPSRAFDLATPENASEHAVALALSIAPNGRQPRARGVIALHCDTSAGLQLDHQYRPALDKLRAKGARLAEVEQFAFDQGEALIPMLPSMMQALADSVRLWGTTDIVAACPRQHAPFYCTQLGFRRIRGAENKGTLLLHLAQGRLQALRERLNGAPL